MSRKESRASIAARRKAIAQRRERAQRAVEAGPDAADPASSALQPGERRATMRARRATSTAVMKPAASDDRVWNALLVGGTAVAVGLLGRELVDIYQDRAHPLLLQNDIYSALGSVALIVIIGVFAYRRRQLDRTHR